MAQFGAIRRNCPGVAVCTLKSGALLLHACRLPSPLQIYRLHARNNRKRWKHAVKLKAGQFQHSNSKNKLALCS